MTNPLLNDDTPGVGQDDYTRWRSHFGQTAGSGAALPSAESLLAAVPEPHSLGISVIGVCASCFYGSRRRQTNQRRIQAQKFAR